MNTKIQALTAGALAAIAASVAIPALTGAQASPARSARLAHARPGASQADQLRALERKRLHALVDADTATARSLMARDFQAIPPTGDPLRRKDYLGVRRGRRHRLPRVRARVPDRGAPLRRLGRPPLQGELRHRRRRHAPGSPTRGGSPSSGNAATGAG